MPIVYESRDYVIESCRFDGESRQRYAVDRKHHHLDHNGRQAVGLHNVQWTETLEDAMRAMRLDERIRSWSSTDYDRVMTLAHCVAPERDPAGIALDFAAAGFTPQEAYDLIDHHYLDAAYVRSLCDAGRTVESILGCCSY